MGVLACGVRVGVIVGVGVRGVHMGMGIRGGVHMRAYVGIHERIFNA